MSTLTAKAGKTSEKTTFHKLLEIAAGAATLHVKNNPTFIRTLFALSDDDIEKLIPIGARVSSLETIPHSCGFACMCLLPN